MLTVSSTSQEVVVGDGVTLTCFAQGRHLPLIFWTPPAGDSHINVSSSFIDETSVISTLTISATQTNNTGTYNCTGVNSVDHVTASIFLQVLGIYTS